MICTFVLNLNGIYEKHCLYDLQNYYPTYGNHVIKYDSGLNVDIVSSYTWPCLITATAS